MTGVFSLLNNFVAFSEIEVKTAVVLTKIDPCPIWSYNKVSALHRETALLLVTSDRIFLILV